ncbi:MAG TPA: DMT family transporter [Polyangiaceae bacterium]
MEDEKILRSPASPIASVASLVFSCLFWGISFPLMQMVADDLARASGWVERSIVQDFALRVTFTGWRFAAATVLYGLLTLRRQRGYRAHEVRGGIIVGVFFTAGLFLQMGGLRYALPSVSAVLTSMVVVFTPLAQYFWLRRPISTILWQSVILALVGMLILALPNPSAAARLTLTDVPPLPWLGEAFTLIASLLFTAQVLAVDHFGKAADVTRFTLVMFAVSAVASLVLGLLLGGAPLYTPSALTSILHDARFLAATGGIVGISSVGAFHLMNSAQPKVSPAVASVIYCTEPVFATMWSVIFGTEAITFITLAGGGLVILAMVRLARLQSPTSS